MIGFTHLNKRGRNESVNTTQSTHSMPNKYDTMVSAIEISFRSDFTT